MTKEPFFLAEAYRSYLIEDVKLKESSAGSYVSNIIAIDRDFFGNLSNCQNKMLLLPQLLENDKRNAFTLLDFLLETIEEAKREKDERFISLHRLNDAYSAFSRYVSFITLRYATDDYFEQVEEMYRTDADLEEDPDKSEVHRLRLASEKEFDAVIPIDRTELYKIFKRRLITQNRPDNNRQELFFPIQRINKIFRESDSNEYHNLERQLKTHLPKFESFRNFIDDWLTESIDAIKVLSKDDEFLMRDVLRFELMPNRQSVNVVMASHNKFSLFTHPKGGEGERLPIAEGMREMSLKSITIEHINTMKSILDDYSDRLTGLQNLATLIRKKKNKNSSPILFEDISAFAIEIVRDLLFIKEKAHLELMGDKFNTNPKKSGK